MNKIKLKSLEFVNKNLKLLSSGEVESGIADLLKTFAGKEIFFIGKVKGSEGVERYIISDTEDGYRRAIPCKFFEKLKKEKKPRKKMSNEVKGYIGLAIFLIIALLLKNTGDLRTGKLIDEVVVEKTETELLIDEKLSNNNMIDSKINIRKTLKNMESQKETELQEIKDELTDNRNDILQLEKEYGSIIEKMFEETDKLSIF